MVSVVLNVSASPAVRVQVTPSSLVQVSGLPSPPVPAATNPSLPAATAVASSLPPVSGSDAASTSPRCQVAPLSVLTTKSGRVVLYEASDPTATTTSPLAATAFSDWSLWSPSRTPEASWSFVGARKSALAGLAASALGDFVGDGSSLSESPVHADRASAPATRSVIKVELRCITLGPPLPTAGESAPG